MRQPSLKRLWLGQMRNKMKDIYERIEAWAGEMQEVIRLREQTASLIARAFAAQRSANSYRDEAIGLLVARPQTKAVASMITALSMSDQEIFRPADVGPPGEDLRCRCLLDL